MPGNTYGETRPADERADRDVVTKHSIAKAHATVAVIEERDTRHTRQCANLYMFKSKASATHTSSKGEDTSGEVGIYHKMNGYIWGKGQCLLS